MKTFTFTLLLLALLLAIYAQPAKSMYFAKDNGGNDNIHSGAFCKDVTVQLDQSGNVVITAALIDDGSNDPCGIAALSVWPDNFTCSDIGDNNVILTVTTNCGDIYTCTSIVTVVDNDPPVIECASHKFRPTTVEGTCTYICAGIEFDPVSYSDNCGIAGVQNDYNGSNSLAGAVFAAGITTITWMATDVNYNVSTCTFVLDIADLESPVIDCPGNQTKMLDPAFCSYTATGGEFDYGFLFDNCGINNLYNNINASNTLNGEVFPAGITTVTWAATDFNNNSSSCMFTVNIFDGTPPYVECPPDQTIITDFGFCSYAIPDNSSDLVSFNDNCGISYVQNDYNASNTLDGAVFSPGTTTITWIAMDVNNNVGGCAFALTIVDGLPPDMECPSDQVRNADPDLCSYTVSGNEFNYANLSDNCGISFVQNDFNGSNTLDGEVFPVGTTWVTWTSSDINNNVSACTFAITVINDQPLMIECPADQTRTSDPGVCTYNVINDEFNNIIPPNYCGIADIQNDYNGSNSLAGAVLPVGNTVVTWIATDNNYNVSTCMFLVTITDDQPPYVECPVNQSRTSDPNVCTYISQGNEFNPTYTFDNCGLADVQNDYSGSGSLEGKVFPVGATTISWIASDDNYNVSTCTFVVTIKDNQAPLLVCPDNQSRTMDYGACSYTTLANEFDPVYLLDNCGLAGYHNSYNSLTSLAGAVFPVGNTTIIWKAADIYNNLSACSFVVTIVDSQLPWLQCPGNQSRYVDSSKCYYTVAGNEFSYTGAWDNCGLTSVTNDFNHSNSLAGALFPTNITTVTWIAQDVNNNTSTCSFTVTVNPLFYAEAGPPLVTCFGSCTAIGTTIPVVGGVGPFTYNWSPSTYLNAANVANPVVCAQTTITYTVTVTNINGCTSSDLVTVSVNPKPTITVAASPSSICRGSTSVLKANGAFAYSWSNGLGTGASKNVTPTGTITYTVSGTDANGCTNTASVTVTVTPTVTITASASAVCIGGSSILTADGAATYSWSNSLGTGDPIVVTPALTTTYTVTGTANSCTNTASATITVYPLPTVTASASPVNDCAGSNTTLTASGASTYYWSNGLGAGNPVIAAPVATTTYTVTGTSTLGCINTTTVTVTVIAIPSVAISASLNTVCLGSSSVLTASGAFIYSWSNGLGNGSSKTVAPGTTTTYTVTGTAMTGCTNSATVTVTVNPVPTITTTATPSSICIGASSVLDVHGASTYSWSHGLGSGTPKTVTPNATTTYTVTGTSAGCTNAAKITVTVNSNPNVTATANPNAVCIGSYTTLTGGGASTYTWSNGLGSANPVTDDPTVATTYSVTGTSTFGCTNTAKVSVTINALPTVTATANPSTINSGSYSVLNASGAQTYAWSNGLGSGNYKYVWPSSTTTYTVTGTAKITHCQNTATVTVTVHHWDKSMNANDSTTENNVVKPLTGEVISYPNPFNYRTTIAFIMPDDGRVTIEIYDVSGKFIQTIYSGDVDKNQEYKVEFNAGSRADNMYIYRLITEHYIYTGGMILHKE